MLWAHTANGICFNAINSYFLVCKNIYQVDFDDELKIGDVRYDNMTLTTTKIQIFRRLPYEV